MAALGRFAQSWSSGILIAVLILLWETGVRFFEVPNFLLPAPTEIAALFVDEWALIQMHSLATVWAIASGYVTAVVFALAVSALMIRYPLIERLIMPIFVGLQSVPKIAIAPLILVWIGAGTGSKIAVVMSIAFFPIVINTMRALKRSIAASQMFFVLLPLTSARCCLGCDCPTPFPISLRAYVSPPR